MTQEGGRPGERKSECESYLRGEICIMMLRVQGKTVVTPAEDDLLSTSKDAVGARGCGARGVLLCAVFRIVLW